MLLTWTTWWAQRPTKTSDRTWLVSAKAALGLSQLLKQLEASPAALIIRTPYQDAKPSQWLSGKTGIPHTALPFTVGGSPEATDLYRLFDATIRTLLDGIRQ